MHEQITSRDNDKIKAACKLRDSAEQRHQQGVFVAEGLKLCCDLCEAMSPQMVFYTQKALEKYPQISNYCVDSYLIAEHVAQKLSDTQSTQGVFGLFSIPKQVALKKGRWLFMENIQNPSNVGTILRSAAAFGFDGAVLSSGCADPYSQKAIRASMGAIARLPLILKADLLLSIQEMNKLNVKTIAAALQNCVSLSKVDVYKEVCIVIGNEGQGLSPEAVKACDLSVRIPLSDMVESLNAAAAASVLLWHFKGVSE